MEPNTLPNEYTAVLRHVLNTFGSLLAAHGFVVATDWQIFTGGVIAIAPYVFAWVAARRSKRRLAAVAEVAVTNELAKPEVPTRIEAAINVARQVETIIQKKEAA